MKKWFENRNIRAKMLLSFAVAIFMTLVVGLVGLFGLLGMKKDMANEAQSLLPEVQSIISIKECQTAIVASERMLSYPGLSQDVRTAQYAVLADQEQQIADFTKTFEALTVSATDAKAWSDYKALQATFLGDVDKFLSISKEIDAGGDQAAVADKYSQLAKLTEDPYNNVDSALDDMSTAVAKESETQLTDSNGFSTTMVFLFSGLTVLAIVLGWLMSMAVSKQISKPINKLVAGAKKLSEGDLGVDFDIQTTDEVGTLAQVFRAVVKSFGKMDADVNKLLAAAKEGNLSFRADASAHRGEYRSIVEGFNSTLDSIIVPVQEATSVLKRTAQNDITMKVEGSYHGDLKDMTDALNETIKRLSAIQSLFINLSKGDLSSLADMKSVEHRSSNDKMRPAAIMLMEKLLNVSEDAERLSMEAAKGNLDIRGDASKYEGIYRQIIEGINGLVDAMVTPLNEAIGVMDCMAGNDFTNGMDGNYEGAFDGLSKSINHVILTMSNTLSDINTSSEQVAAGTGQVAAGSQALSQGATEQASAIEQLTSSLEEIAEQTKRNAVNAGQANELANTARENAIDGNTRMKDMQRAMAGINESSRSISKIIKVIDDIAFQTNLLALNAAVEAARAGQHGKGFAVVAEEVRNLAQRSANAAKETTSMIEESIKKVKEGTKMADETAEALSRIVSGVEKAAGLVGDIAKASNDQATAVAQVNKGIEQMSQVTQTNSATAEESAAASEELSSQATLLKEMVGSFSLRGQASPGAQRSSFQPAQQHKAIESGRHAGNKPRISLNDSEFGKY